MTEESPLPSRAPGPAGPEAGTALASLLEQLDQFGGKLGLEPIRALLAVLGNPEAEVPFVLVAGTNGKGSTSALLAAMTSAAGYRTGLYTSPHLEGPEERLRIDGEAIATADLAAVLDEVLVASRETLGALPSYFEALTAAARLWFSRQQCDLAVFEVGLGGRLDATNTGTPLLSVITSIGHDHQNILGESLSEIAGEKAGILRPGVPLVTWGRPPVVGSTLRQIAEEIGAPLAVDVAQLPPPERVALPDRAAWPPCWRIPLPSGDEVEAEVHLLGSHQATNATLAVAAATELARLGFDRLEPETMLAGLASCRWPGRLERIEIDARRAILLDGAHNASAARALCRWIDGAGIGGRPLAIDLLFASLRRKRVEAILPRLARRARRVTVTEPREGEAHPAGRLADLVAVEFDEVGPGNDPALIAVEPDVERALDRALEALHRPAGPDLLLACGSLYLVGDLRPLLYERFGRPVPARQLKTA